MRNLFRSAFVVFVIAACTAPQGPQGDPGPQGQPGPPGTGTTCDMPKMLCNNACADLQTDKNNCGACGVVCTDACVMGTCCGDGKKNGVEQCDKSDLGGATCATAAAPGWTGNVACTPACKLDNKGCTAPQTSWNDFSNGSNWTTFDVSSINGAARGFNGAAFDGKNIYFVPHYNGGYHGTVARYDTSAGFGTGGSWSTFDISSLYGNARGFQHATFDGRYVYFAPGYNGSSYMGLVARYDTQGQFTTPSSWSAFDFSQLWSNARGYQGAIFDGRYVYFIPYYNGGYHGLIVRYDTQGGFGFTGSWSAFDATSVHPGAKGYIGGGFDGRYVYFTPYYNGLGNGASGLLLRYDSQVPFGSPGGWTTFDMTTVASAAKGYEGASFDGRYLYFAPYHNGSTYHGLVARLDTQKPFDNVASYETFDATTVNGNAKGFINTRWDGRYVYFVQHYDGNTYGGVIARYDTTAMFSSFAAWSTFNTTSVNGGARGYLGSAFDGRYLYLSPYYNGGYDGIVARLDAKSVAWLPKEWNQATY